MAHRNGYRPRQVLTVAGAAVGLLLAVGCSPSAPSRTVTTTAIAPATSAVASSAMGLPRVTTSPITSSFPSPQQTAGVPDPVNTGITAGLRGQDITRIPTSSHVVALTFDAGANNAGVTSILATLSREKVPATFFMTGTWAQLYPTQARAIGALYRLADHSMSHPHFTSLSLNQAKRQVLDAASSIMRATGQSPAPWFRFPYGDMNASLLAEVNALGYISVGWTIDTLGWQGVQAGATTPHILARVLGALTPGEIVLMHVGSTPQDGSTPDADALSQLIAALRARGYGFVTVDALRN